MKIIVLVILAILLMVSPVQGIATHIEFMSTSIEWYHDYPRGIFVHAKGQIAYDGTADQIFLWCGSESLNMDWWNPVFRWSGPKSGLEFDIYYSLSTYRPHYLSCIVTDGYIVHKNSFLIGIKKSNAKTLGGK